jgi:arylsulfatase A-like enzyme
MNANPFYLMRKLPTLLFMFCILTGSQLVASTRPNIILIFADDLGYGDLSCFGHPTIATPHLDRMAAEGQKWTSFYAAEPICTPSRAGLLTGRYPVRSGTSGSVFFEWSASGMDPAEVTLAEVLSDAGYRTGMVGKWHLGHREGFMPTDQGFDYYFGVPYSNDMRVDPQMPVAEGVVFREGMTLEKMRARGNKVDGWVPLMEGCEVIEYPCDQSSLTTRYTRQCLEFIRKGGDEPFFLYYAQTFPHIPLYASEAFLGSSRRGLYGDVVEEMDASIGSLLTELRETGLDRNTLVIFTSDNGPWASEREEGGSSGLLRGAKGSTWEGGVREPTLFWWPGKIGSGGISRELGSTLDLLSTIAGLAGATLPDDRPLDSMDLSGVLLENQASPRETFAYYRANEVYAIRHGDWKAHFITEGSFGQGRKRTVHEVPELYHLGHDPGEQYNIADEHPDIIVKMLQLKANQEQAVKPSKSRFKDILPNQDLPDWVAK